MRLRLPMIPEKNFERPHGQCDGDKRHIKTDGITVNEISSNCILDYSNFALS